MLVDADVEASNTMLLVTPAERKRHDSFAAKVAVIEPAVSGIHGPERSLGVAEHYGVPAGLYIENCDFDLPESRDISDYCATLAVELVGRVPFGTVVTEARVHGKLPKANEDGTVSRELLQVWAWCERDLPRTSWTELPGGSPIRHLQVARARFPTPLW